MQAPHCIKPVAAHLSDSNVKCNQRAISVISVVKVIQMCIYRRGARVSFGLWILKVKGPTLFLHILNFHCLSFTKRRPKQLSGPLQQSKYTGF